jgi:hypothetical protein
MNTTNEATNAIISNVTLMWVHLDKPVSPFGTEQYDLMIQVPKKREKEIAVYGKTKDVLKDGKPTGMVSLNLKKKAFKADGTPAAKVKVVDAQKNEIANPSIVGNGSEGNIKVMLRPYQIKGPNGKVTKSGTQVMLSAVQVTKLVKYEPSGGAYDFDAVDGDTVDTNQDF